MYRILIVDDEPLILNGLVELCHRVTEIEIEVYAAATSQEALDWLGRAKVDIVLSDIRMPGMSGLELHQEIMKQWPKCKVIFLTGYSDFSYVQQAIRQGSVDYILKTEGNAKIKESILRAAHSLEEERYMDSLFIQAQQQKLMALPYLQQQYMSEILQGDPETVESIHEKFDELHIKLSDDTPCLLMIARIDEWGDIHSTTDRALIYFALDNITSELLMPMARSLSMKYEKNKMVWFLQPAVTEITAEGWSRTLLFIREMLAEIQQTCLKLLKRPISLALAADAVKWSALPQKFDLLNMLFHSGLGIGKELILLEPSKSGEGSDIRIEARLSSVHLHKIEYLKASLENGHEEPFFETLGELLSFASQAGTFPSAVQLELYFLLVSVLLPHSLVESDSDMGPERELNKFTQMERFESWHQICDEFIRTARKIFEQQQVGMNVQEHELIRKIQNYVTTHMSVDVSLTKIGEVVGHNPSYLSRLYKKLTGQGLLTYINDVRLEKSKVMLEQDRLKVHEIATELGFLSSQYFHRFFKKATNLTPQEYRELKREPKE
ncbi:response regulator [Paenibacillus guangzhouensis]|uniref:response regulator n=1 Tax=Paenibacillus guangzhouensis TaxID=1473112 RepID=UPI001266C738|nr:response regulator [Paenibacillus guangzhouensis]